MEHGGTLEEVADMAVFIVSPENSSNTGLLLICARAPDQNNGT
jgi:hypothetical protein